MSHTQSQDTHRIRNPGARARAANGPARLVPLVPEPATASVRAAAINSLRARAPSDRIQVLLIKSRRC